MFQPSLPKVAGSIQRYTLASPRLRTLSVSLIIAIVVKDRSREFLLFAQFLAKLVFARFFLNNHRLLWSELRRALAEAG